LSSGFLVVVPCSPKLHALVWERLQARPQAVVRSKMTTTLSGTPLAYAVGAEQPHAVDDRLPKVVGGWLAVAARVQGFLDSGNGRLIRHPLIVNLEFRRRTPKAFPLKVGCINA
jgi:hypothetical protein